MYAENILHKNLFQIDVKDTEILHSPDKILRENIVFGIIRK